MRIVSWNCNSSPRITKAATAKAKFMQVFTQVQQLRADIVVLQEAPDPGDVQLAQDWKLFWNGGTPARGIAVALARKKFPNASLIDATRSSLLVDTGAPHNFLILGVWSCPEKPNFQNYLLETRAVVEHHRERLREQPAILAGDFNSNASWDPKTRKFSHTDLTELLANDFDLHSAYHNQHLETPGRESAPTYFHHRHTNKPFHLDYAFLPASWQLEGVTVGEAREWLGLSDHLPLITDFLIPSDSTQQEVPRADDVVIDIRTGEALSFHLRSPALGWSHGDDAALDLLNLDESLTSSGVHDILTCSCGVSDCSCGPPRERGVKAVHLADGDALWHDRDRDLWHRLSRHQLRRQMLELSSRCEILKQEFSVTEGMKIPIHPYRSQMFLSSDNSRTVLPLELRAPSSESARRALAYFPDLPDNAEAAEIREFTRWIDEERLFPLGTKFQDFVENLLQMLPQVLGLPQAERRILILTAAAPYHGDTDDSREILRGFPKLRASVGELDTIWQPLFSARSSYPFDPRTEVPTTSEVRLPLLAALLRFGEFLTVSNQRPSSPIPRDLFEPEEVLIETNDPSQPYILSETPFDKEGLMDFWRRAYTSEVTPTPDRGVHLSFRVPSVVAESYTESLVLPRVQELSQLLEIIRPGFEESGMFVGPLSYIVENCDSLPRMPDTDEELFGMELPSV